MKLYAPSTIRAIKEQYGFKLSKSLGQNFLTDKNIIDQIILGSQIGPNDLVIEIGPGIGVLTWEASQLAKKVIAIEIDQNLIPILKDTLSAAHNVEVIHKDVLKTDINEIIARELERETEEKTPPIEKIHIIGNLPYYITTPIIMKLLEDGVAADTITVMMQKEVADRIKGKPGSKDYGALSVAVQYYCQVNKILDVPRDVFMPQPNVDSTVLRLDIYKEKMISVRDMEIFFSCVKAGFGQRRKTLSNSLMNIKNITKEIVGESLHAAQIDPQRRAETLTLMEFAKLADEIAERLPTVRG